MILSLDDQTIIAQCTPKGSGAIALLRISGINAVSIADAMSSLMSGVKLSSLPSHTVHLGYVLNAQGKHIDQVMFTLMLAPKTFTGQDTVEITSHNNPFIIEAILHRAIECGARIACEGEFSKRAVLNNKIDLLQAEAINELIHANTQMALKKSLEQLEGSFSHWIASIEKNMVKALAFSEASFEFIDEEMAFGSQINGIINNTLSTIESIKKTFDAQAHIRQGIRIAIIGSVNAGKSSLFNSLLNKERAIVTAIAGTTRDVIEAGIYKNDNYWTLIDTAGLRTTHDIIEQEGIARSYKEAQLADIILLVLDFSRTLSGEEEQVYRTIIKDYSAKVIPIANKSDLPTVPNAFIAELSNCIKASNVDKTQLIRIEQEIQTRIEKLLSNIESPFLLNQRQFNLLLNLEKKLFEIVAMTNSEAIAYELLSFHLNDALAHMSELTGKTISEKGMDAVFREFCVGK
jgi:tRNA modification GTPase